MIRALSPDFNFGDAVHRLVSNQVIENQGYRRGRVKVCGNGDQPVGAPIQHLRIAADDGECPDPFPDLDQADAIPDRFHLADDSVAWCKGQLLSEECSAVEGLAAADGHVRAGDRSRQHSDASFSFGGWSQVAFDDLHYFWAAVACNKNGFIDHPILQSMGSRPRETSCSMAEFRIAEVARYERIHRT